MNKEEIKKLSIDELSLVSGGTPDEAFAYLDELKKKYGVGPNETLDDYVTDEEADLFAKLFWQGLDV